MNDYQKEQLDALSQVRKLFAEIGVSSVDELRSDIPAYLNFRSRLDRFLDQHTGSFCTTACFSSRTSACCSKDGIITFWADVVINALCSDRSDLDRLHSAIISPHRLDKCIYLGTEGCLWRIRPLICAMFICDHIQTEVLDAEPDIHARWQSFQQTARSFRWPDKPVLFDHLEEVFMERGCRSPLMYINTSPGLLRIKRAREG